MYKKLTIEEKEKRSLERRQMKFNETHKFIDGVDHKVCKDCGNWFPSTNEYFYENGSNNID
ncbi:hypothetical protein [Cytobacillus praedii]|uniref:hypothetical protein n=1 Tax=Cytobacillus praedii TaxID=1742358 RepID=UPI002E1D4151|nr:hypothetical protein [Cytobacillus praedii]